MDCKSCKGRKKLVAKRPKEIHLTSIPKPSAEIVNKKPATSK